MSDLPEPLVPAHVDLNGYEFMPLYGEKLRTSSLNTDPTITADEKWAALQLWWASWWQIPAASLPNSDVELAHLAGCKSSRAWSRVKAQALRKWVLCSDNRWYHPFLAPLAVTAFATRKSASTKGKLGAQKRWENKDSTDSTGNASAIHTNGSGYATAMRKHGTGNGTGNGNRSEVNTPQTPRANALTSTATPTHASHSIAKAEQTKAEMRAAAEHATPPPDGKSPLEFFRDATKKPSTPDSRPFQDEA